MKLLRQSHYFERLDDRFVYRPTIFSAGISLSRDEKDRLFEEFKRLERRLYIEGFSAIVLIAGAFMAGIVTSPTPIPWFMLLSTAAVILLALLAFHRRQRAVIRVLGHNSPDVPPMPFRQALTKPRPILGKRHSAMIIRSAIALFLIAAVVIDVIAAIPIIAALLPRHWLHRVGDGEAIAEALSHTLYSAPYWAVVVLINILLLGCAWLFVIEMRRLRALPDIDELDSHPPSS